MDNIYQRLDQALARYADEEAACVLDVSELDGFFHALGCAPAAVPAAAWLPAIWGGEAYTPAWASEDEARQFHADAMAHYQSVMDTLAREECAPVFLHAEIDGEGVTVVDAWCEGFLLGMDLWPEGAAEPPDELLEPILFFTVDLDHPEESEQMRAMASAEEVELLQELIPQSVFGLRAFYGLQAPPPQRAPAGRRPPGKAGGKPRR